MFYEEYGYVVIRNLVPHHLLDRWRFVFVSCQKWCTWLELQLKVHYNIICHFLLFTFDSQRFRDICDGKVDKGRLTLMKDLSLMKTGATGERLYNKLQDFMWDEVLYEFI